MRAGRTFVLLAIVALLPLIAPAAWLHSGGFPHIAVLVVTYIALEFGPARAAWCGAAIGFLACPWTVTPLGQQAFVLGLLGFTIGSLRQSFNRELASVQLAFVAVGALVIHVTAGGLAGGVDGALHAVPSAFVTAATTSIAAPPVFGLLGWVRLVKGRRRFARV